jgi:hypothetical protein
MAVAFANLKNTNNSKCSEGHMAQRYKCEPLLQGCSAGKKKLFLFGSFKF